MERGRAVVEVNHPLVKTCGLNCNAIYFRGGKL